MATPRLSSIPSGDKPIRRHRVWPQGDIERFYREVVLTCERGPDDECLIWPYARGSGGYGQMKSDGRRHLVHRRLCEDVNGPPPTPDHQSAHSCNNGRLGCVTKRHLSWKTRAENMADKLIHGTVARGERHGMSKLTEAEVRAIVALKGMPLRDTAARFNVSRSLVCMIQSKKSWAWLG